MPSTYAHYRFGQEVFAALPESLAKTVRENRALYDIGLHGPDLLFYYKPLESNAVNRIGFSMHAEPAEKFFSPAAKLAAKGDGAAAYAYGFVCHFALDSACHSYIENKIRVSNVRHTEIESEFDRSLLLEEGKDPLSAVLTSHIAASEENAGVIAPFFGVTEKQAYKALRSMLFYNSLVRAPHAFKRGLVNFVLKISGNYKEMHGMMIAKRPIKACEDSDLRLKKLFEKAVPEAVRLIGNFAGFVRGENALSPAFGDTFSFKQGWENIPVLSPEEEKNYEV